MRKVARKIFHDTVGNMEVAHEVTGNYPYQVEYRTKNGRIVGKVVNNYTDGIKNRYPIVKEYYIND